MTTFGLFPEGLLVPTLDDLIADYEQEVRSRFGPNFPLGDDSFEGFLGQAIMERLQLLWDTLDQVLGAMSRDKAGGLALRSLGLLTATIAPAPTPSTATITFCGDPGSPVSTGTLVKASDSVRVFATVGDPVALVALPARATLTHYAALARVTNSLRCYQCVVPGDTDSGPGPSSTAATIVDGTATWTYIGDGGAAADSPDAEADVIGPTIAVARTLSLNTPTFGVNTAINLLDAALGVDETSDEDFRVLAEEEVTAPGTGTLDAVEADLAKICTSVQMFENTTEVTDGDGLPAHSFEALVQGGVDQDIRDSIQANKPAGIDTHGSVVGTALDRKGKVHTIRFSRPTEIPVFVDVTLRKDPALYVGDASVKAAVAAAPRLIGRNVVSSFLSSLVFRVAGVTTVPRAGSLEGVLVGVAPGPTSDATLVITSRQLATYDTSRVTVHSSDDPDL